MHDETNTSEPNWADSGNALYVIYQSGIPYCYYYYYYHYYFIFYFYGPPAQNRRHEN